MPKCRSFGGFSRESFIMFMLLVSLTISLEAVWVARTLCLSVFYFRKVGSLFIVIAIKIPIVSCFPVWVFWVYESYRQLFEFLLKFYFCGSLGVIRVRLFFGKFWHMTYAGLCMGPCSRWLDGRKVLELFFAGFLWFLGSSIDISGILQLYV